ncbi:MAG: [Clostridia bacterium]|nr:[FeFe] hydrogenase H-cluster radical SAM maturase HydE [Clostridia bacterium]
MKALEIADKLIQTTDADDSELLFLLKNRTPELEHRLQQAAQQTAIRHYGRNVFIRGLIEFTSYCKNDCYYCGLRRSNACAERYRLTEEEILSCCESGYEYGFRTFVLQGGEDAFFTDERLCSIVRRIRERFSDCAITLSVGERSEESYRALFRAGANRYLLRHETATDRHYKVLHPAEMTLENRLNCLDALRSIGYQVGCGIMVGSPGQTTADIVRDLRYMKQFRPHMVGIGPFIPHKDTPFKDKAAGTAQDTVFLLSIVRLMLPEVLLPATTALGTILPNGRELGIQHGANVVMPNLSPQNVRKKYMLYDNKLSAGAEAAESLRLLEESLKTIGYEIAVSRGDSLIK